MVESPNSLNRDSLVRMIFSGSTPKSVHNSLSSSSVGGCLQVFNCCEVNPIVRQELQRNSALTSSGVVVYKVFHFRLFSELVRLRLFRFRHMRVSSVP